MPHNSRIAERSYEQHRTYVLAALSQRCAWLDASDREAAFHDAYAAMLEKLQAGELPLGSMHARQVRTYLTLAAVRKALDEGKRAERKRTLPLLDDALEERDLSAAPDQRVAADMDSAPVREIVAELPERQQIIVKLRFYIDRTPDEIQRLLGIGERVYRRELERAMRRIAERYEIVRAGRWCDDRRSLVLGYVAGVAGPKRARQARTHLASCPACAHLAVELRTAARSVAAVIPLPAMALGGGSPSRVSEFLAAARDTMIDLGTGAKQQGIQLATRIDPGSLQCAAAARPGSVAAAVVGCVAAASGATYCVVADVPKSLESMGRSLRGGATHARKPDETRRERAQRRLRAQSAPTAPAEARGYFTPRAITTSPAARSPRHATPPVRRKPAAAKRRRGRAESGRSAGEREFAFESTSEPARTVQTSPARASSTSAGARNRSPTSPSAPSGASPARTSNPPTGAPGVFELGP